MKVLVWLSINDAEATASKVVEVLPGTGLTIPFGALPGFNARALADVDVAVVLEPEPVPHPEALGIVTAEQLEDAFAKWAGAGSVNPNGLPVREHAWTVWRAAYYWALIQRTEGYAAAMAALDRKEEPRL
jgi:hypothetical protein